MHAAGKLSAQRLVDQPVPVHSALASEGCGHHMHRKVGFSPWAGTGVAGMVVRIIYDFEKDWRKGGPQLCSYLFLNLSHGINLFVIV